MEKAFPLIKKFIYMSSVIPKVFLSILLTLNSVQGLAQTLERGLDSESVCLGKDDFEANSMCPELSFSNSSQVASYKTHFKKADRLYQL